MTFPHNERLPLVPRWLIDLFLFVAALALSAALQPSQRCVPQARRQTTNLFAVSCSTRDGYYYWGENSCQHLRASRPLRQQGYCRSAAVGRMRPARLPGGLQLARNSSSCATHIISTKGWAACRGTQLSKSSLSHRPVLEMLCSKGSDGESEAMNATLLQLRVIARLISCRATPCNLTSASHNAGCGRSGAYNHVSSRFTSSLERALFGTPVAIGTYRARTMETSHLVTGPSATRPGSPLAFPRALLHVQWTPHNSPSQDEQCEWAVIPGLCCFAHSGR